MDIHMMSRFVGRGQGIAVPLLLIQSTASPENAELLSLWLNNQGSRSKTETTVLLRIALAHESKHRLIQLGALEPFPANYIHVPGLITSGSIAVAFSLT
jgi:hypothetical protein